MTTKYAHQLQFSYGWDYVGSEDGKRLLFDTFEEARDDLKAIRPDLKRMGYARDEWRVVRYRPEEDSLSDL